MVMEVLHEDMCESNMQCTNHPFKNSSPGGICALCLQEKLGKLVSSSFPVAVFPSSSSSSSPSLRSEFNGTISQKLPIVSFQNKMKNKDKSVMMGSSDSDSTSIVFKRSKSTTDYSQTRGSFWSFLYLSKHSNAKKCENHFKDSSFTPETHSSIVGSSCSIKKMEDFVAVDENSTSPDDESSFDRKVSRSRSVGCGSRSFSGDLFDRISTGLGDCTLRRVESQRESGKSKIHRNGGINGQDCIKERVSCGGIFSGFMVTPSSSYLHDHNNNHNVNGKSISNEKSKSWGWTLASPIRAFSKRSAGKRAKNTTPNLAAIPSLLAV